MASPNHKKTALITGASTGIGYELARLFAADGYDLIIVARNKERLDHVASEVMGHYGTTVYVMPKDLSIPGSPDVLFEEVQRAGIDIEVLVNNAGFGRLHPFADDELATHLGMMQLNMVSLVHLTRLFLPGMLSRRRGKIINVSSIAAYQPGPMMAVYYASKAFVTSFSEALSSELHGTGVSVTTLTPGPTRSEFQARAGTAGSRINAGPLLMDSATVARIGYEAMNKNKRVVIAGWSNRLLAFVSTRLAPRSVVLWVTRYLNKHR